VLGSFPEPLPANPHLSLLHTHSYTQSNTHRSHSEWFKVQKICNLCKSVAVLKHKSISALQHLYNSDCCVYLSVISHSLRGSTLYTPGRISDSCHIATRSIREKQTNTHHNYAGTHANTHTPSPGQAHLSKA